jgi:alkanesulfonate monooxygenase
VHIITGGSDGEQRRDGDHLSKDERYDRTDEYLDVLVRAWTSDGPFGYQGRYYQVEDAYADVASVRAAAAAAGRDTAPRISVSFRPIIGATEELAWERAHQILATTRANIEEFRGQWRRPAGGLGGARPQNRGSQRLLAAAAKGDCTTGRCGRRWPPPPAPPATPPRWSGRRTPWPRPCSITWASG